MSIARLYSLTTQAVRKLQLVWLRAVWGMDIGDECIISLKARLDRTNPKGVHIGRYSGVAFGAVVLAHDFINNRHVDTWIGDRVNVGANAIILPGVRVGHGCVIAAGSVVTRDIPDNSLVMGNPARVVEKDIVTGKWGIRVDNMPPERLARQIVVNT